MLVRTPGLAAIWNSLARRQLRKGQHPVQMGGAVASIWHVEHGLLRMFTNLRKGSSATVPFMPKAIGWGLARHRLKPSAPMRSRLWKPAPWSRSLRLAARTYDDPPRVTGTMQSALDGIFARQNQRVSELLMLDAGERYQAFLVLYGGMAKRLHHVAIYLGITNVALSRIRRRSKS